MNKQQKDHIIDRIIKIGRIAHQKLEKDPKRWLVKPLTNEEIYTKLATGDLKLRPFNDCMSRGWNSDTFKTLDKCVELTEGQREGEVSLWYITETKTLISEAERLKDRIILGDAKEALKLLYDFQSKYGVDNTDEEV